MGWNLLSVAVCGARWRLEYSLLSIVLISQSFCNNCWVLFTFLSFVGFAEYCFDFSALLRWLLIWKVYCPVKILLKNSFVNVIAVKDLKSIFSLVLFRKHHWGIFNFLYSKLLNKLKIVAQKKKIPYRLLKKIEILLIFP